MSLMEAMPPQELVEAVFDRLQDSPPHIDVWVTAGPKTDDKAVMARVLRVADVVRFNGAQNTDEEAETRMDDMWEVAHDIGRQDDIKAAFDFPGPKTQG